MRLFDKENDISLILEMDASEAVRRAACDLQGNLRRLSGKARGFEVTNTPLTRGIWIKTVGSGTPEAYCVSVEGEKVTIAGSDILGTVFGIYAFATKCLHISPVYRLTDLFPEEQQEWNLAEQRFSSGARPVRFRGWFLNDEDLLTEYKISGGHRNIDYPFYQNVMDESVLDMILETALRLEINLMIPSSFVDIDNPDEEKLVRAVCQRGMYVSQHHVEPMGVSYFAADNYIKKRGYEGEQVSFINNRKRMEEIWRYYAEKWAKYAGHVVWQLGLRGKADVAVWKSDPNVPLSMEARGGIITDAIQTQYDIIRQTLHTDCFYSTATLWNEGSKLYGMGCLKLPGTTIPIFSDCGLDQMFGEDFYSTQHEAGRKYGIYYHAAFWGLGPHLTEGCNPEKMAYCYREAAKNDNLYYSILNISNVRPVHISAMMNARILQSPLSFEACAELQKLDTELFGEAAKQVNEIRRAYYAAFADFGKAPIMTASEAWYFYHHDYGDLPFIRNPATDGQLTQFGKYVLCGKPGPNTGLPYPDGQALQVLQKSAGQFRNLYQKAEEAEKRLSDPVRTYFRQFLKYQIRHMQLLTEWCIACMVMTDESVPIQERKDRGLFACSCLETLLDERKILECGAWQNWHRGEKKVNLSALLALTEQTCKKVGV